MNPRTGHPLWQRLHRLLGILMMCAIAMAGCESYFENQQLRQERRDIQEELAPLEQQYRQATKGKTQFTDEEKARIGPLFLQVRNLRDRLAEIDRQL